MKNLKRLRESLGTTQAELAKRTGLTPAAISQIESGQREPGLKTILAVMKVIPATFEKLAIEEIQRTNS